MLGAVLKELWPIVILGFWLKGWIWPLFRNPAVFSREGYRLHALGWEDILRVFDIPFDAINRVIQDSCPVFGF